MRAASLATALLLDAASLAAAAEPPGSGHAGNVGIDLVAAPQFGLAIPFRLSDHLTFRAMLGAGSSQSNTGAWMAGGDLRYTLAPLSQTSVFLSVQSSYLFSSGGTGYATSARTGQSQATPVAQSYGGSGGMFGGGLGVRRNVGRSTSAYAELRYDRMSSANVYQTWGTLGTSGQNRFSFGLGVTMGLK
ncbi:MAG: hypothetical protein U0599_05235 [Vicinamibacteria bacterium]